MSEDNVNEGKQSASGRTPAPISRTPEPDLPQEDGKEKHSGFVPRFMRGKAGQEARGGAANPAGQRSGGRGGTARSGAASPADSPASAGGPAKGVERAGSSSLGNGSGGARPGAASEANKAKDAPAGSGAARAPRGQEGTRTGQALRRGRPSQRDGQQARNGQPSRGGQPGRTSPTARGATGRIPTVRTGRRSVVGAKVEDVSGKLQGRGLPKGGIRGQGSLTVDKNALGDQSSRRSGANTGRVIKIVVIVVGVLLALLVAFLIAITLLSHTSAFSITEVEASDTEHVSADSIVRLANVQDGTTLLNVDTKAIEANLERNPWILSATITREFPDKLRIDVTERQPAYLVVMGTGNLAWYLGPDNVWIEPKRIETQGDESVTDAAMTLAQDTGSVVITEVPTSVSPVAGTTCTDDEILSVVSFQSQFSDDLKSQIVCYSAPDTNGISCVLSSGVQISLGSASNIDSKETVINQVLAEYSGQITFLNVRVPSKPSYRGLSDEDLVSGTGANGTSTESGTTFTDEVADGDGNVTSDSSDTSSGSDSSSSGSGSGGGSGSSSGSGSGTSSNSGTSSSSSSGASGTSSSSTTASSSSSGTGASSSSTAGD